MFYLYSDAKAEHALPRNLWPQMATIADTMLRGVSILV